MRSWLLRASLLLVSVASCSGAWAQVSVVSKTTPASALQKIPAVPRADTWKANVDTCAIDGMASACLPAAYVNAAASADSPSGVAPHQLAVIPSNELQAAEDETEKAVNTAISALFKSQHAAEAKSGTDDGDDDAASVQPKNLFQITDKLEWRIESTDFDAATASEVGFFASHKLMSTGEDAYLKFDAGISVESKTGNTAGKAGFSMAW
jgi:hypothetical protein